MSRMEHFIRYWSPMLLWMVIIFGASGDSHSVQHTDSLLLRILTLLHIHVPTDQFETVRWWVRKCAHMIEYGVMALLLWRALRAGVLASASFARTAAAALVICVIYASSDEFHQSFVKDRTPSVRDVLIDTFGAAFALALLWVLLRIQRSFTSRAHPAV